MGFVRVLNDKLVCDNVPMRFRGLGVGSWLNMEHFMLGMPTPDQQIRESFSEVFGEEQSKEFFHNFMTDFFTEADCLFLKEIGVNLLRVPFNYRLFIDDKNPGELKRDGFHYLDNLITLCEKHQIYLLPDLHAVPGGQNPDWHSDNQTGVPQFWHYEVFQDQIVELWRQIAVRYKDKQYILGYDLLNEPFLIPEEPGRLQKFYDRVTAAIRQEDSNHIIFLEGDFFAMDFSSILAINDEQTALTFHYYPTVWEADLCDRGYDRELRRKKFEEGFLKVIKTMEKWNRPMLCGEAGYDIAGDELGHVLEMIEDTLDIFEKYQVSWTLWSYKDAQHMGLVYPQAGSPWMRFVDEIHKQWDHFQEMNMGKELVDEMNEKFAKDAAGELKYHLQFRQRALLYSLQKELILKPQLESWGWPQVQKMPESFRAKNCEHYKEYADLLHRYMK